MIFEKRAISAARAYGALQARAAQGVRVAPQLLEHASGAVAAPATPGYLRKLVLAAGDDARLAARTQQRAAHPLVAHSRGNAEQVTHLERNAPHLMEERSGKALATSDYQDQYPASQLKKDMLFGTGERSQLADPQGLLAPAVPQPAFEGGATVAMPNRVRSRIPALVDPALADTVIADTAVAKVASVVRSTKFRGLDIAIETDKGQHRHWHDPHTGKSGKTKMKYPYGYIRRTEGMDGDEVDVFVGPDEQAQNVYVITTNKAPDFKEVDEQKCMLGFDSGDAAKAAFRDHYNNAGFFRTMKTLSFDDFSKKALGTSKSRDHKIAELTGAIEKSLGVPLEGIPHTLLEPKGTADRSDMAFNEIDLPQTNVL